MKAPSASTLLLGLAAALSVALVHRDPWGDGGAVSPLVSTKSNARRLLPEIADRSPTGATIELLPAHGDPVRIVPTAAGTHEVWAAETPLGPADPEAVEGLWASLRMATTLRAVPDDAEPVHADTGRIRIVQGDAELELWLGRTAPDDVGLYGGRVRAPQGVEGTWVVEREVGDLLSQAPRAWLALRAAVVEPAELVQVTFADGLELRRGDDGAWRSELAGRSAMLESTAVEHRLQRLVAARLDPLFSPEAASVATDRAPWVTLGAGNGRDVPLWLGESCPGRPERVLVSRGPGLLGCLDAALTEAWPAVGRGQPGDGALVDPHLLPPAYGRVLSIAQAKPEVRTLARYGGGWRIEEVLAGQSVVSEVDESEVFRFYDAAHGAEVELAHDAPPADAELDLDLTVRLDAGTQLRLRCIGTGPATRCRRDDGPWLSPRGPVPELAFDPSSFADRRLVELSVDDVRALEILPGPGREGARQGAHFDLGVWRLDAPLHPAGDDALDEERLGQLLATIAGARAEAWIEVTDEVPVRTLRIDRSPRRGQDPTVVVELLEGCRVRIPGRRAGLLSEGTCASLSGDLLRSDVLRPALWSATSVEITVGDAPPVRLQDDEGTLRREDGAPMGELSDVLARLQERRLVAVRAGRPPGPVELTLRVRPRRGAVYEVAVGRDFIAFDDETWWLRTEQPSVPPVGPEL